MGMIEEVGSYLASQLNWIILPSNSASTGNIFYSELPSDSPDRSIVLYQYSGRNPQYTFGPVIAWEYPRLQVVCRQPNIEDAYTDANAIYNLISVIANKTLSGTMYLAIQPIGKPQELGPDANNRQRVVANYEVWKVPS